MFGELDDNVLFWSYTLRCFGVPLDMLRGLKAGY